MSLSSIIRTVFLADIHLDQNPKHQKKVIDSFEQVLEFLRSNVVDFLVISGDFWENLQTFQGNSGVGIGKRYLRMISEYVRFVLIVKGNNEHDPPGSIELLHLETPNILAYEKPTIIGIQNDSYFDLLRIPHAELHNLNPDIIFPLVPYPNKAALVESKSIDSNNDDYLALFDGLMDHYGNILSRYDCPKAMGFHAEVVGTIYSNGQTPTGSAIRISPKSLLKAGCHFYGGGHIHLPQEFINEINLWMGMIGGFTNKNWGETDQKRFVEVEFYQQDGIQMKVNYVPLIAAKPMVRIKAEFKDGNFVIPDMDAIPEDCEKRFDFKIQDVDKALLTPEKKQEIQKLLDISDADMHEDLVVTATQSRCEDMANAQNIYEETERYANHKNVPYTESLKEKVTLIQDEVSKQVVEELEN